MAENPKIWGKKRIAYETVSLANHSYTRRKEGKGCSEPVAVNISNISLFLDFISGIGEIDFESICGSNPGYC